MTRNDVTSSFVQIVDVDPAQAREVLARINPMRSLADRLSALGLDDRAMWARGSEELSYQLVWRFGADGGHANLVWRLAVHTDGAGRTVLSVRLEGRGSDTSARSRLLSSWTFLEELAAKHAQRLARTLDDLVDAEESDDGYASRPEPVPLPRLRAVV
jgi:hypothetical protein